MTTQEEAGVVAVRSVSGRILTHKVRPPNGEFTICGRYDSSRYMPPETQIDDLRMCGICRRSGGKL